MQKLSFYIKINNQVFSKMKLDLNLLKKVYCKKGVKKRSVQFALNLSRRMKKEELTDVPIFFVFHALIIGVQNVVINVHFAEPNLLRFFIKMQMEIVVPKILIF
jgi:hypothetical protein